MVVVLLQFEPTWVNPDTRSDQGRVKKVKKKMFNFEKQRYIADAECAQESNGAICFSVHGLELSKIAFDCMTSPLCVMP